MDPSLFVRQHQEQEIVEIVDNIVTGLQQSSITPEEGNRLRLLLVSLSGKVITHLAAEDNALYQRLLKSHNPEVARIAGKFADEMGSISEHFDQYISKWFSGRVICERFDEFRATSEQLFEALSERIHREENELYKLARNE